MERHQARCDQRTRACPRPAPISFGRVQSVDDVEVSFVGDVRTPVFLVGERGCGLTFEARRLASTLAPEVLWSPGLATALPLRFAPFVRSVGGPLPDDVEAAADRVVDTVGDGVLVIDDAHLLDEASTELLARLCTRVKIVATAAQPHVSRLQAVLGVTPRRIEPMTPEAIARLAPFDTSPVRLAQIAHETGGLAGVIVELVRRVDGTVSAARYRQWGERLDGLGADAIEWIASFDVLAGALAASETRRGSVVLLGASPPASLVDQQIVRVDGDNVELLHTALAAVARQRRSQSWVSSVLGTAARRSGDDAKASDLFEAAGEPVLAAEHARRAIQHASDPDRLAVLVARASRGGAPDEVAHAARGLIKRELVDHLAVLSETVAVPTWARLACARLSDDEATRCELVALMPEGVVDGDLAFERDRTLATLSGRRLPMAVGAPGDVDADLDGRRLAWGSAVLDAVRSGDVNGANALAVAAGAIGSERPAWKWTGRTLTAIVSFHADGTLDGDLDAPVGLHPVIARAVLDAHRVVALADSGRSGDAFTLLDHTLNGASPLTRSLRRWAVAEAELAAGHPVKALRAAAQAPDAASPTALLTLSDTTADVLATLAGAWGAFESGADLPAAVQPTWPSLRAASIEFAALERWANVGADESTVAAFGDASDAWESVHLRGALRCTWAAGEVARRSGDVDRARDLLADVETAALRLGMLPLLSRCRQSLRRAGVRAATGQRATTGALSAREHQVLVLVGKGLDTRAIAQQLGVGTATVETQVSSAMTKLGARSRLQAAMMLQRGPIQASS